MGKRNDTDMKTKKASKRPKTTSRLPAIVAARPGALFQDVAGLIIAAKEHAAVAVNAELSMLYWNVGNRINKEVLGDKRAEYGKRSSKDWRPC